MMVLDHVLFAIEMMSKIHAQVWICNPNIDQDGLYSVAFQ